MASAKTNRIIYWVATGLLCALMTVSASGGLISTATVAEAYGKLGFPAFIVLPLSIAKILGVVAILTNRSQILKEWAYAGIFFDLLLAFGAHINAGDSDWGGAAVGMVLLVVSRYFSSSR